MSDFINDGAVQFGAREITIGGNVYEADDFSVSAAVADFVRTNYLNKPTGQVAVKGILSAKATLQYGAANTPEPLFGAVVTAFNAPLPSPYTALTFAVKMVGRTERKEGECKCPVEFMVCINGAPTVS